MASSFRRERGGMSAVRAGLLAVLRGTMGAAERSFGHGTPFLAQAAFPYRAKLPTAISFTVARQRGIFTRFPAGVTLIRCRRAREPNQLRKNNAPLSSAGWNRNRRAAECQSPYDLGKIAGRP